MKVKLAQRLSRREKWARFIADELWRRDPLSFLGVSKAAELRGTTLLTVIKQRRDELQRFNNVVPYAEKQGSATDPYESLRVWSPDPEMADVVLDARFSDAEGMA